MEASTTGTTSVSKPAANRGIPTSPDEREELDATHDDYIERNRRAWESWAPAYAAFGREAWQDELRWGIWRVHESELQLLEGVGPGADAVELGCGTASVSGWLARHELRAVGVDFARSQLVTASRLQREFDVLFDLICANAEDLRFEDGSFDLAVSEYGASLWCDPRRWLPKAHRLLRPNGRLIFITNSPLLMACTSAEGGTAKDRLVREHSSSYRLELPEDGAVEFHLSHGQWVQMLRATGFTVENLIEVKPPPKSRARFEFVSLEWAQRWPSEDIWVVRKTS